MMRARLACGLLALVLAADAAAQAAVTAHEGSFGGRLVRYHAHVEETAIAGADGAPGGTMVTTAYLARDAGDPADRPVLFMFSGGPGASTTPLHFGAFGPLRRHGSGDDRFLAPNPHSVLDVADLVFIDPIGTGYSRPAGDGTPFWSRSGDADSVIDMIRQWIERHGRAASPRYLLGQSYGTVRAAEIVDRAPELGLHGVLLFALVPSEREGPMALVTSFPSYAVSARYHGRGQFEQHGVEDLFERAIEFARSEYHQALLQADSLSETDKRAMARALSQWTGLSAGLIESADLRIDNELFIFNLLKDQGLRTGQLDARAVRRLDAPAQRPPYDDPGLNYVPASEELPELEEAGAHVRRGRHESEVEAYYRDVLGYDSPEPYIPLNLDVNSAWDHEGFAASLPLLARAMAERSSMRLFWAAGYYDLSTPAYAGRFSLEQAGIPAARLTAAYFPAGHSVFVEAANLQRLAASVRAFITGPGPAESVSRDR